jgi:hypothetical protein
MRKFLTVLVISTIYFAWIGVLCLADADTRGPLLLRESPVVGPLGDGIQGPEYYPEGEWIVPVDSVPSIADFSGSSVNTSVVMPVPEPDFVAMGTPLVLFVFFRLWLFGRRMR